MADFIDLAKEITDQGEEAYFGDGGRINRAAMKSVFVDLSSAADKLPDTVADKYPDLPWKQLRGMRSRLAHDYGTVRDHILWVTAVNDLPGMAIRLKEIAVGYQDGGMTLPR